MHPENISFWAVGIATVACFLVGGLWYSPILFGKVWQRENALSDENLKSRNMGRVFGAAFVLSFVMALNLAVFLSEGASLEFGALAGALAGFGWVAMALGVTYLFESKSLTLYLIDAGYHVVTFILMGAIIGAMQA